MINKPYELKYANLMLFADAIPVLTIRLSIGKIRRRINL
jgi:hypothetical protein